MGLRLSPEKTLVTHIDEGLDFLGWRIQRHRKPGADRHYVYTYPSRKAVKAVTGKVKTACREMDTGQPLDALLRQLNPALQGWCAYFRPGVSSRAFAYLSYYTWQQVGSWLRRKHHRATWKDIRRRYCAAGWWPASEERQLFNPAKVNHHALPIPGSGHPVSVAGPGMRNHAAPDRACGAPGAWKQARRVREAVRGNGPVDKTGTAPRADFTTHLRAELRAFTDSHPDWLTVIQLPAYTSELNPSNPSGRT